MWQASALTILWLLSSTRASTRKKMTELWCWAAAGTALGPGNSLGNIAVYSNGDIIKLTQICQVKRELGILSFQHKSSITISFPDLACLLLEHTSSPSTQF